MGICKAVIPAAGLGTRLLPATKSQPKEMLPVGRKPTIQYVVEELESAGIDQILIITGQKKRAIEDHFDRDTELIRCLEEKGNHELIDALKHEESGVRLFYTRQSEQRGTADAIKLAESFVDGEPFVVCLGDSITRGVRGGVTAEQTYEHHLQQWLTDGVTPVTVINKGIGGERTDQAMQRLANDIIALRPDIVTIM